VEGSRAWLRENLHALDADRHVALETVIQPGSTELQSVFTRARDTAPLANDTSIGVGYAPMSALERLVLAIERRIGGRDQGAAHPARGEDIKVMAVGNGDTVDLSIACAMIGGHLAGMSDYLHQKFELEQLARQLAQEHGFAVAGIAVNAADHPASGSIYLTVTGTSAEAGDDGQVGRGNRVNGLITPMRPMSLEAAAGKNPISHTGKLYNVVACRIAERLVAELAEVAAAECYLVSRIGVPVTSPSVVYLRLQTRDDIPLDAVQPKAAEIAHDQLGRIRRLVDDFVEGTLDLY
jgi:S-adenosylmethionine synthetase